MNKKIISKTAIGALLVLIDSLNGVKADCPASCSTSYNNCMRSCASSGDQIWCPDGCFAAYGICCAEGDPATIFQFLNDYCAKHAG